MKKEIPKIQFKEDQTPRIEVMNFEQMFQKLIRPKKHDSFAPHKIEFYLIIVLSKNIYWHFVDFKLYQLVPGSAIFVAKNQVHHFTEGLQDAEGFCIVFNSLLMNKYHFLSDNIKLNRLFNYHIETPVIQPVEKKQNGFLEMANILFEEQLNTNEFAKSEMMRTLLHVLLLRAERTKEIHALSSVKTRWLEIFSSFKDLLEEEYTDTRNARYYASKLLISYKFLNDIVKNLTNKTAKAFIDDFVTTEIKRYLVSTSLSIKEISYQTGFEEPANMVRFFKKNTQTTPLKFRQNL